MVHKGTEIEGEMVTILATRAFSFKLAVTTVSRHARLARNTANTMRRRNF
jgi:hypothetical protein